MGRAAILVIATLGLLTAAGAVAAPRVYYRVPYGDVVVKPQRIEFSDLTIRKIRWRDWGAREARGRGRTRGNTCVPSCANGQIVHGTAKLRMFRRHREGRRRFYGCMTGRVRAGGTSSRIEWPPGCRRR